MQQKSMAQLILEGPIDKHGQQHVAIVIAILAGPDGWAATTQTSLAKCMGMNRDTLATRLKQLLDEGMIEEREKPTRGYRATAKALGYEAQNLGNNAQDLGSSTLPGIAQNPDINAQNLGKAPVTSAAQNPGTNAQNSGTNAQNFGTSVGILGNQDAPPTTTTKNISNYLEEVRGGAGGEASDRQRPDQPAAQPPAKPQAELLPAAPAKPKPKRKRAVNRAVPLPPGWQPEGRVLNELQRDWGIPIEFSKRVIGEFVGYWEEAGGTKKSWGTAFRTWVKKDWDKEQQRAQRERFTDASGRPISAKERAAEDILDAALKPLPGDQPVSGGGVKPLDVGQLSTADLARLLDG